MKGIDFFFQPKCWNKYWKVQKWKVEIFLIVFLMPAIKQNIACLQFLHTSATQRPFLLNFKEFLKEKELLKIKCHSEKDFFFFFLLQSHKMEHSQTKPSWSSQWSCWPYGHGAKGDIFKPPRLLRGTPHHLKTETCPQLDVAKNKTYSESKCRVLAQDDGMVRLCTCLLPWTHGIYGYVWKHFLQGKKKLKTGRATPLHQANQRETTAKLVGEAETQSYHTPHTNP